MLKQPELKILTVLKIFSKKTNLFSDCEVFHSIGYTRHSHVGRAMACFMEMNQIVPQKYHS